MVEILEVLIQLLNIDCSAVNCYYANPFEGLFYLVLLPAILLIVFLYLLMINLKVQHKGIQLLVVIGVFIFIILQGWFTIFISLSVIWIIIVIILGVIRAVFRRGEAPAAAAPGGGLPGISGFLKKAKAVTLDYGDLKKAANQRLGQMKSVATQIKTVTETGGEIGRLHSDFDTLVTELDAILDKMAANAEIFGGWAKIRKEHSHLHDEKTAITADVEKFLREYRTRRAKMGLEYRKEYRKRA